MDYQEALVGTAHPGTVVVHSLDTHPTVLAVLRASLPNQPAEVTEAPVFPIKSSGLPARVRYSRPRECYFQVAEEKRPA
jgi:hypothetical protein